MFTYYSQYLINESTSENRFNLSEFNTWLSVMNEKPSAKQLQEQPYSFSYDSESDLKELPYSIIDIKDLRYHKQRNGGVFTTTESKLNIDLKKNPVLFVVNKKTRNVMTFIYINDYDDASLGFKSVGEYIGALYSNHKHINFRNSISLEIEYKTPKKMSLADKLHRGFHGSLD